MKDKNEPEETWENLLEEGKIEEKSVEEKPEEVSLIPLPRSDEPYIFTIDRVPGKPLDLREARREYTRDPIGFAAWELRRAKTWANLIAEDYDKACRIKPSETRQTQQARHEGAVNYVKVCQQRLDRAIARADKKGGKRKGLAIEPRSARPPIQTTFEEQLQ